MIRSGIIKTYAILIDKPHVRENAKLGKNFIARFVPESLSFLPFFWAVAGDVVYLGHWEEAPFIIRIKSRGFARGFRKHFWLLWKIAKE